MLDASVLFSPASQADHTAVRPQPLPAPNTQDVMRFEQIMMQGMGDGADSAALDKAGQPLLQIQSTQQVDKVDFKEAAVNTVLDVDSSYHRMLGQFSEMPRLGEHITEKLPEVDHQQLRSYPDVGDQRASAQQPMDAAVNSTREYMQAALEYNGMMTRWTMNSNMWMSKFTLISSAVNQISSGFKTLFRTGG